MVVVEASVSGFFRTILIIIGGIVALRFLGQLMIAKRNMEEEREMNERQRKFEQERSEKLKKFGKISILGGSKKKSSDTNDSDVVDVDYEEVKE
jgi:hypothetical protein